MHHDVSFPSDADGHRACSVCLQTCVGKRWVQVGSALVGDGEGRTLLRVWLDENDEPVKPDAEVELDVFGPVLHLGCLADYFEGMILEAKYRKKNADG